VNYGVGMNARARIALSLLLPALLSGVAVPAAAVEKPARVITLTANGATLGIDDLNAPGSSPGDVRTLSLALTNIKGQPAGRAEIVQTLTHVDGNVGTAVKVVVLNLPRGTITGLGVTEFTDFTSPQSRPNDETERIAITGGTDAYRGASGQIDVQVLPNFASRWIISLDR